MSATPERRGTVRAYYDGLAGLNEESSDPEKDFENNLERLRRKVNALLHEDDRVPAVNAALNQAQQISNDEMGKATQGISLPGMM